MDFVFTKLLFTLKLEVDTPDPFALYAIKEDFMQAFRKSVCRCEGLCGSCPEKNKCSYYYSFSQALADDPAAVKRHQKPPLPFVFDMPLIPALPNKGKELEIGLTLAGSAINFLEDYINAVCLSFGREDSQRKVRGIITRVESLACSDFRNCIMENGGNVALDKVATISARDLSEMNTLNPNLVKITIISPMRILQDRQPLREFEFSSFVRSLLRRISSLAYYYYGSGMEIDYKWLSALSTTIEIAENNYHWTDWQRDRGTGRLSGIVGNGSCQGGLEDFHSFLLLGEYFHAGKNAAFGLGRYRIDRLFS
jgi:hypothetical protein